MNVAQHAVLRQLRPCKNRVPQGRLSLQPSLRDSVARYVIQTQHCVLGYIQMPLRGIGLGDDERGTPTANVTAPWRG